MNVHFNLARQKENISLILLSASWEGNRLQVSTGLSIEPKLWDKSKERARKNHDNFYEINRVLDNLQNKIEGLYFQTKALEQILSKDILKLRIKEITHPQHHSNEEAKPKSLVNLFQEFIDIRKSGNEVIERNGKPFGDAVIKSYVTTSNYLKEFEKTKGDALTYDNVNNEFYTLFTSFLIKEKKLNNNTVGKVIKNFKVFMRWSIKKEYTSNMKFIDFKVWEEEAATIALSQDELDRIENLDLLKDKKLSKIRDLLLIQIYTGLRFSDLINLSSENIKLDEEVIMLHTIKTKESIIIPISHKLKTILLKYNDMSLPKISNQKYNDYIKIICEKAKITEPVKITTYKGNKREDIILPKYKLISSHTARRTFITLSLRKGVQPELVMKVSGHKKMSTFQKYVRITQNEAVEAIKKAWK